MSVELRPLGVLCNIQCGYCYQDPQRDAGNVSRKYDIQRMKQAVEQEGGPFTLFGGEPLLLPLKDLEEIWAWGYERYGSNRVQTNATLIRDEHVALFHKYGVRVGISMDGPGELNDVRWHGDLEQTRESTARSQHAVERLCAEGIRCAVIVTLHRGNATADRLPRLTAWVADLHARGVVAFRLHLLETEYGAVKTAYGLSADENIAALLAFLELERTTPGITFDLFPEMRALLVGDDRRASCIWNGCDPFTTRAVRGVEGHGQRSNCGRTNKDGIDFVKAARPGFERYIALYHTPQAAGGCGDCRFFLMCKGQCPGTAIDGDWRNRTEHCQVWMTLYERLEAELQARGVTPLSRRPERRDIERAAVDEWSKGRYVSIDGLLRTRPRVAAVEDQPLASLLGEGVRLSWVSEDARDAWADRLGRIVRAWPGIEASSVAAGVRPCALVRMSRRAFESSREVWRAMGLSAHAMDDAPATLEEAAAGGTHAPAEPRSLRIAVGGAANLERLQAACRRGDADEIGLLLGYPRCCRTAFVQRCQGEHALDHTWPMAYASSTEGAQPGAPVLDLRPPSGLNMLWRHLGIRPVPHVPCQCGCSDSIALSAELRQVAMRAGLHAEMEWLDEVLAWPVEWSALHGIAQIKTPVLKTATRTDATAHKLVVRWHGERYPANGARGIVFPYRASARARAMESRLARIARHPVIPLQPV